VPVGIPDQDCMRVRENFGSQITEPEVRLSFIAVTMRVNLLALVPLRSSHHVTPELLKKKITRRSLLVRVRHSNSGRFTLLELIARTSKEH